MSLIIFSHANSFPASTYRVLFKSLRARGPPGVAVDETVGVPALHVGDDVFADEAADGGAELFVVVGKEMGAHGISWSASGAPDLFIYVH